MLFHGLDTKAEVSFISCCSAYISLSLVRVPSLPSGIDTVSRASSMRKPGKSQNLTTWMIAYRSTDATMMMAPVGVKLSVVTPVPNRLHLRVSFLFMARPWKPATQQSV